MPAIIIGQFSILLQTKKKQSYPTHVVYYVYADNWMEMSNLLVIDYLWRSLSPSFHRIFFFRQLILKL